MAYIMIGDEIRYTDESEYCGGKCHSCPVSEDCHRKEKQVTRAITDTAKSVGWMSLIVGGIVVMGAAELVKQGVKKLTK